MFSSLNGSNVILLYHLSIFLLTMIAVVSDLFIVDGRKPAAMKKFGGRWRFLTIWNLDLQLVYFGMSLFYDTLCRLRLLQDYGIDQKRPKLVSVLFAAVVYPVGIFVSITFWILYAVDRELVFPKVMDQYVPSWINHCLHTNIVLYILVELWLVRHEFPSIKHGFLIVTSFVAVYFCWVHFLYFMSGVWVYPILHKLPFAQRYLFMAAVIVAIYPIYLSGDWLHRKRWGLRGTPVKTMKKVLM